MKKVSILALVLVFLGVLMGMSYAAFNEDISINDSFVDTGQLDVNFTKWLVRTDPRMTSNIIRIDDNTVQVTVNNLYPGGRVWIDVDMTNQGTIPVKFESAELTVNDPGNLLPYLRSWCWLKYDEDGPGPEPTTNFGYIQHPWRPLTGLADAMNNSSVLKSIVLEPGGWISFEADEDGGSDEEEIRCICIRLDKDAPNDTQNKSLTFTLRMNWKQWNQ